MKQFKFINIITICLLFLVTGCSDNEGKDILSLMSKSPSVIIGSDFKDMTDSIELTELNLMINDDGKYSDLKLGSHVVERKILVTRGEIGYLMDVWPNLTLEKSNLIYSNLTQKYGKAKEIKLESWRTKWNGDDRVVQQFEVTTEEMLVTVQLKVTKAGVYSMSATYASSTSD